MKIISWNINSLRLRLDLLAKLAQESAAEVICLQETKVADEFFPQEEIRKIGFPFLEFSGEKSYNGVAILSKKPLKNSRIIDVLDYGHRRHINAELQFGDILLDLHNFYVPAGGDLPDRNQNWKFDHKLKFVDWMAEFFENYAARNPDKSENFHKKTEYGQVILGDFNIAPLPNDVWSHQQMLKIVSHTEIEVEKLNNLLHKGNFIDSHRFFIDHHEKLYSWWSYRAKEPLVSNRGRRLDHIWVSQNLKNHLKSVKLYTNFRLENQPSDHIPIELEIS